MRKKIIISILLIIIIFQTIIPLKSNATEGGTETGTGLPDTITGIIIEPTVEVVTFLIDAIMAVVSDFMMPSNDGFQFVMVNSTSKIKDIGEASIPTITEEIQPYKNAFGVLDIRYPNFTFSAEDIFSGKVELLNVDFISGNKSDGNPVTDKGWTQIRGVIQEWYKILRMVTIIGLLSILIYTGIKIILSSNVNDKAKYKEMIVNWFVAVILAFSLHYIMAFIMNIISSIMNMLDGVAGVIPVEIDGTTFNTNLIGLARFRMQQQQFSAKLSYLIIYVALVIYTFKFTFVYLKRVLYMAFLTIISPIVALTYPIDKMDGKAKGFEMWLKEYMYNVLLQPMHYILYYVLVTTSLSLAASNPLYAIAALAFVSNAEKLLKKIFGIDKAKEGTVNGLAKSFATGAMVGALNNAVRDPLHPFGNGKNSKGGKGGKGGKNDKDSNNYLNNPKPIYDNDWSEFDDIDGAMENPNFFLDDGEEGQDGDQPDGDQPDGGQPDDTQPSDEQDNNGENYSILEQIQQQYSDDPQINEIFQGLNDKERETLQRYIEQGFTINGAGEYFNPYTSEFDGEYTPYDDERFTGDISSNQGISLDPIREMAEQREFDNQNQNTEQKNIGGFAGGMLAVGKALAKPVWDFEHGGKYNGKRLVRNLAKGVLGTTAGVTAAAVQAGISITDGKYKATEGIATFAAGYAGMAGLINAADKANENRKDNRVEGDKQATMKRAQERFRDREDVIAFNKKEFPDNPKKAMERQRDHYLTRGITDLSQMKQCMNYANVLMEERGMTEEEADRRAAATFDFRKKLQERGQLAAVYSEKKRDKYIDILVKQDVDTGTDEGRSRNRYLNAFKAVQEFDAANE